MSAQATRDLGLPATILVVLSCLVAGVVWLVARGNGGTSDPRSEGPGVAAAAASGESSPGAASKRGTLLPEGEGRVRGYPVEFPASDLGAVALDTQVARSQIGFDYGRAVTVAGVYAAAEDRAVFEQRSREAVALRRTQAGVPLRGEVPAPASYAATPIAFTVEQLDTDYYVVNLLSYITLTTADGRSADTLYAGTQLVRWIDGDWRLVRGANGELERLAKEGQPKAVAPGTPAYEKAGWIALDGGHE